jgi:hypothetical protein
VLEFAGDFLTCWGEGTTERGPWGEKAIETGGVATEPAAWEGCLDAIAVGVAILCSFTRTKGLLRSLVRIVAGGKAEDNAS